MHPEYASLADLEDWARRVSARQDLPVLLRRLILATLGVDVFRAPGGDAVGEPGWDIVVDAPVAHEPWIPVGASRWEGGVGEDPQKKAQSDFVKRTKATPLDVQATQTFVFFTPHRWTGGDAEKWIARKLAQKTNAWADIRVVDGVALETWLETQPGPHLWVSELVGKVPSEVELLGRRWERWSGETAPALTPAVIVAGRTAEAAELVATLDKAPVETRVGSDTVAESLGFFASAMPEALLARAVVVTGPAGWLRLATHSEPLILLPTFDDPDVQRALNAGHHVLIAEGPRSRKRLPRLDVTEATAAFQATGLDGRTASEYARAARRSLSSLRRRLGRSGPLRAPEWAAGPSTAVLGPLLLAGAWLDSNKADLGVVHELTDVGWRGLNRQLQPLVNREDPPLRVRSGRWEFLDLFDAWDLLASAVTGADLATFHELVVKVVTEPDPVLDLPAEERKYAEIRDVRRTHSPTLRAAMARTVAALGAVVGDRVMQDGRTGQEHADAAVRRLLADDASRTWISLADVLPDLAEAAPVAFLEAVERALAAQDDPLGQLFAADAGVPDLSGSGSRQHWLLWALERLTLNPKYLARAVLATGRLAELESDPDDGNSAHGSLLETLHLMSPQGAVTRTTRRDTLDLLRARHPEIAWQLLIRLVPSTAGGVVLIRGKASWRDWQATPSPPLSEVFESLDDIVSRLATDVDSDPQRLRSLVDVTTRVPSQGRATLLAAIRVGVSSAHGDTTLDVARLLGEQVAQHRTYADAEWSLPEEELAAIESLALELDPSAMTAPDVEWFSYWPRRRMDGDLPPDEADALIERERNATVERLLASGGVTAVTRLAAESEATYAVGFHLAAFDLGDDEPTFLALITGPDSVAQAVRSYVAQKYRTGGLAWLEPILASSSEEEAAELLRCCPPSPDLQAIVDAAPPDVQARYWQSPPTHGVDDRYLPAYVERLLDRDRPWTALGLIAFQRYEQAPGAGTELVLRVLEALPLTSEDGSRIAPSITYHLGRLLNSLEAAGADTGRLARIEWWFQPLLAHVRKPRALFRQLARDPEMFAQLVVAAFRPDPPTEAGVDGQDGELDDQMTGEQQGGETTVEAETTAARLSVVAFGLLRIWHVLPATECGTLIDADTLAAWVARAEELLVEAGRLKKGLYCIGEALAGPITDPDGTWPSEPVRQVIEARAHPALEEGLYISRVNQRGVTSRGATEGGDQERVLAEQYQAWADRVRSRWPRTGALLDSLAARYAAEARWHDERTER